MPPAPFEAGSSDTAPTSYAPQTARGRATRQRLLEAAVAEFGEKGFHAASVSAITTRARIGQGTFYIYFSSKDACFRLVVYHTSRQMRRALLRGLSRLDLEEALHCGLARCLKFTRDEPHAFRALNEARLVDPESWNAHNARLVHSFTDLIERHASVTAPCADRALYAHIIVGALHHIASLEDEAPPEAEQTAAAITALVMSGIVTRRDECTPHACAHDLAAAQR